MCKSLITLQNCRIENSRSVLVPELSWKMNEGEVWLVIGPNGGGKADFLNALAGGAGGESITPNADGLFSDFFSARAFGEVKKAKRLPHNPPVMQIINPTMPESFLSDIWKISCII